MSKMFEERFGKKYTWVSHFRNKYDVCRRQYKKWMKLVHNRTGLGFDSLGRVDMSDDWWEERSKEWPGARMLKNKPIANVDLFEEEFGAVMVSGAEGWSAQHGESSLDSRVDAEQIDEADSVDTEMAPPAVRTKNKSGSSGSKRKRREIDVMTDTCSSRNAILSRKNDLVEQMVERSESSSVERVLGILNGLPGVRKWSAFHKASVDHLIADVANRQGFMAFSSDEDKISYLEHRTGTIIYDV